ncbi:MAG: tellurite resistance protein TerC [Frankiales bacterium]|jgi:tellurite resistance protein TerC|nr:tellurite resistance protein TerC [Frankiales bacterium]
MDVPGWVWAVTLVAFATIFTVDLVNGVRNPHPVTTKAAARAITVYVVLALSFALGLLILNGSTPAGEFLTGYVLEYSLSVDNLFVYLLIMSSFNVPESQRGNVLLVGIVGTLALRFPFILGGAAAADRFNATFYVFGAILVWTAYGLLRSDDEHNEAGDNIAVRIATRVLPATDEYDGGKLITRVDGKRKVTPLLLVMVAMSIVGLVFALDSIPAIFGITTDTYVIVTANAFALMGLRQLYFLVGGLLERLVYLSTGLAIILAFIGVKLVLEALHKDGVHGAPEIGTAISLGVVIGVLAVTTVLSLRSSKRNHVVAEANHPDEVDQ